MFIISISYDALFWDPKSSYELSNISIDYYELIWITEGLL